MNTTVALAGGALRPVRPGGPVTGYGMAVQDLTQAYLRYGRAGMRCLYEPDTYQEAQLREMTGALDAGRRAQVGLVNEYDLLFRGPAALGEVDILHSVREDAISLLAMRRHLGVSAPLTFIMHGLSEQHLLMDLFYPLLFLPFRPYDAILCTSDGVARAIGRILERLRALSGPEMPGARIRLERLPLGVDTEFFRPMDRRAAREAAGIAQDAFVILWFGRLSDTFKADLHPLLHVFRLLLSQNPGRKLCLVLAGSEGGGSYEQERLRKDARRLGIEPFVMFLDNKDIPDRARLYAAADVFTSPVDNIQETFGLTPVEAMACGVPQVVSDWDGYRDTVVDGETGFRVRTAWSDCMEDVARADYLPASLPNRRTLLRNLSVRSVAVDCGEYVDRLQRLLDSPDLLRRMGAASRERALRLYSLRETVRNTERVWERLRELSLQYSDSQSGLCSAVPMVDYTRDFAAYPTRMLDGGTVVALTRAGEETDFQDLPHHQSFFRLIEEAPLPGLILDWMRVKRRACIRDVLPAFPDWTPPQIKRSVMYLYKYDMIRVEESTDP